MRMEVGEVLQAGDEELARHRWLSLQPETQQYRRLDLARIGRRERNVQQVAVDKTCVQPIVAQQVAPVGHRAGDASIDDRIVCRCRLEDICLGNGNGRNPTKIGRASCRERVCKYVYISVVDVSIKKKK